MAAFVAAPASVNFVNEARVHIESVMFMLSGWLIDCVMHHPSEMSRRQLLFDALMLLCRASTESVTLVFCGWHFDVVREISGRQLFGLMH